MAPRVKAAVTDKILQGWRPLLCITLLVARSLGELGRGPGKARAARGHSVGLTEQLLDWPKSSSGFSVTAHGGQPNVYQLLWKNFVLLTSKR